MINRNKLTPLNFTLANAARSLADTVHASQRWMYELNQSNALAQRLIVANDQETYLIEDALNPRLSADESLTFLCRPYTSTIVMGNLKETREQIQNLTVAQIRANIQQGKGIHFIYNITLAKLIENLCASVPAGEDITFIPVCPLTNNRFLFPLLSPSGHSYSLEILDKMVGMADLEGAAELLQNVDVETQVMTSIRLKYTHLMVNKALMNLVLSIYENYQRKQLTRQQSEALTEDLRNHIVSTRTVRNRLTLRAMPENIALQSNLEEEINRAILNERYWNHALRASRIMLDRIITAPVNQLGERLGVPRLVAGLLVGCVLGSVMMAPLSDDPLIAMTHAAVIGLIMGLALGIWALTAVRLLAGIRLISIDEELEELSSHVTQQDYNALKQILIVMSVFDARLSRMLDANEQVATYAPSSVNASSVSGNFLSFPQHRATRGDHSQHQLQLN